LLKIGCQNQEAESSRDLDQEATTEFYDLDCCTRLHYPTLNVSKTKQNNKNKTKQKKEGKKNRDFRKNIFNLFLSYKINKNTKLFLTIVIEDEGKASGGGSWMGKSSKSGFHTVSNGRSNPPLPLPLLTLSLSSRSHSLIPLLTSSDF
jgi:hypothetical protein